MVTTQSLVSTYEVSELEIDVETDLETPSKKMKLEPVFTLPQDRDRKTLPDPFPFPDNYSPILTAAIANKRTNPRTLEKMIIAFARSVYGYKCYPTTEELMNNRP